MMYKNEQGSYDRRLVVIPYTIKPERADTGLSKRLGEARGVTLVRMSVGYLFLLLMCKRRSIKAFDDDDSPLMGWKNFEATKEAVKQLDPVYRFLVETDHYEFDPGGLVPEDEFILEFRSFRQARGMELTTWTEEIWTGAFNQFGLRIIKNATYTEVAQDGPSASRQCNCIAGLMRKV